MEDLKIPLREVEKRSSARKHVVLLTGASSFVAGHILQRLLANEIHVHATVRAPNDQKRTAFLRGLPNAETHLKLFKADLLKEGSFDEAMKGCDAVIHTASPYVLNVAPGKEEETVVEPALKGTENILGSVERTPSVKRVVLTSSVVALYGAPDERGAAHAFDENDWAIVPKTNVLPYFYSKKVAEQRAWELHAKQSRWSLVTILPGQVWGPPISIRHRNAESVKMMCSMLNGAFYPAAPPIGLGFVDVRDVALAHSLALLDPRAKGRYILVSDSLNFLQMADILRQKYPSYWLPFLKAPYAFIYAVGPYFGVPRDLIKYTYGKTPMFDTRKAREELGIRFLSPEVMLWDEAARLQELGLIRRWFGFF